MSTVLFIKFDKTKKMLLKIDRHSIRRNPEAGQTEALVPLGMVATFSIDGELPDFLIEGKNCRITGWRLGGYEGRIYEADTIDNILKNGLAARFTSFSVEERFTEVKHFRTPDFLFEYENPTLACNNCRSDVHVKDIRFYYDSDEIEHSTCPVCSAVSSFEDIHYENIHDAIKDAVL